MKNFRIIFLLILIGCSKESNKVIKESEISVVPIFSEYGECSARVCEGTGIQSRSILSCSKNIEGENSQIIDQSFCSEFSNEAFLNKRCWSPSGTKEVQISNGLAEVSCLSGSTIKNIHMTSCNIGYDLENNECKLPNPLSYINSENIAVGYNTTCAIGMTGKVYCWGKNDAGQLGNNSSKQYIIPSEVYSLGVLADKKFIKIISGNDTTCVLSDEGKLYCWGNNKYGQLGLPIDSIVPLIPIEIKLNQDLTGKLIKDVSIGERTVCVIANDDKVYCWGRFPFYLSGYSGIIWDYHINPTAMLTKGVLSDKKIKKISSGGLHTCVIASDNKAYCWGVNTHGELGNTRQQDTTVEPIAVDDSGVLSGKSLIEIYSGPVHTCALDTEGKAYCWGSNYYGQLGNNSHIQQSLVPTEVDLTGVLIGKTIKSLSVGESHTYAITSDGNVYGWGMSRYFGSPYTLSLDQFSPLPIYTEGIIMGQKILSISSSWLHTCVIAENHQAYCWGNNFEGQLGSFTTIESSVPQKVYLDPNF